MKNLTILLICLLFSYSGILSQDLIYPEIEKELTKEQKEVFDNAVLILQKATGNENNAEAIDWKYRKKRNSNKWELKIWEAKEKRIMAERNYQEAYSMISGVYSSIIKSSIYKSEGEKSKALSLNKSAEERFGAAKEILSKHKDLSQIAMANTQYELLMADLKKSHNLKLDGIREQISALEIKRIGIESEQELKEDLTAWEKAKNENTVASYHQYLNNNPRGQYMSEANNKIRSLEQKANDVADNNKTKSNYNPRRNSDKKNNNNEVNQNNTEEISTNNSNIKTNKTNLETNPGDVELIFKVQIAASKSGVSDWILSHKAPNADLIEEYR